MRMENMVTTTSFAEIKPATMNIGGVDYIMELGLIEKTFLGYEDHGVFTGVLELQLSGGGSQGAGCMILDAKKYPDDNKSWERIGTAYGHDWIIQVMRTVGVESWEGLVGRRVYALKEEPYGWIRGLANVSNPSTNYLIFAHHAEIFNS